jgi:hypothetical protein
MFAVGWKGWRSEDVDWLGRIWLRDGGLIRLEWWVDTGLFVTKSVNLWPVIDWCLTGSYWKKYWRNADWWHWLKEEKADLWLRDWLKEEIEGGTYWRIIEGIDWKEEIKGGLEGRDWLRLIDWRRGLVDLIGRRLKEGLAEVIEGRDWLRVIDWHLLIEEGDWLVLAIFIRQLILSMDS